MSPPTPLRLEITRHLADSVRLDNIATTALMALGPDAALEYVCNDDRVIIYCTVQSGQALANALRDCIADTHTARDLALACGAVLRQLSRMLDRAINDAV